MSDKLTDMRNIRFMLYEVLDVEALTKYPMYEDHSKETFEMALEAPSPLVCPGASPAPAPAAKSSTTSMVPA